MMFETALAPDSLEQLHARLMAAARRGDRRDDILARMLASWSLGYGAMPRYLGLGQFGFQRMLRQHFPGLDPALLGNPGAESDARRFDEMGDLRKLLMENRTSPGEAASMMVDILIAGCMGGDHLWQDLGLWNRADLSYLMRHYFAPLAQRNVHDMKWKKFLYKQLCETEGIYTCRAPSCQVCADYQACFGPEH